MDTIKNLLIVGLLLLSLPTMATTYNCVSLDQKEEARLTFKGNEILWSVEAESASSSGVIAGVDTAPYSETKGEVQYKLIDFAQSANHAFYLSIPSAIENEISPMKVTFYLDNDDVREEETVFSCTKD